VAEQILIAGGGIGGLVTSLLLHRAGITCRVFESAPGFAGLGVGINLLPHAVRELTLLGLDTALEQSAIATACLTYVNKFGQTIWSESRGREAGYSWPQYSIHRGRLQTLLFEAARDRLGAGRIHTNAHLSEFQQDSTQVHATFLNRQSGEISAQASGTALIAADGIHSAARRAFYPNEGPPQFSGRLLWRAVSECPPFLDGRTMIMAGHANQKFVAYPIAKNLVNWVAELHIGGTEAPIRRDWNRRAAKSSFAPAFRSWRFPWIDIPGLIESAHEVFEFPMVDRDPVDRWTFNRVTLLGDAAHPMYPIGSNGASQAILDASALTEALTSIHSTQDALAAYEHARLAATAAIVHSNRLQGPEAVMQLAEERAPNGFEKIEDIISNTEMESIATTYKQTAGFDRHILERK